MTKLFEVSEILVSYKPKIGRKPVIASSLDAYNILLPFFSTETIALQEQFVALYLNRSNRVLGGYKLSTGGITGTVADIRLILSVALNIAALGIILAHNHPSGNLRPSRADEELTANIKNAAKFMEVKILDHIIFGEENQYFSFADEGIL